MFQFNNDTLNRTILAATLNKLLPRAVMASVLECMVSCDGNDKLTDDEAEAGMNLFDDLMEVVDEATILLAQGCEEEQDVNAS